MKPDLLKRWVHDARGIVAIEFALIVPVMLLMYAGLVELCEVLSVNRKINQVATSTADLVAQNESITPANMTDIFAADAAVIAPYDATIVKILACAVYTDTAGAQRVRWCKAYNDTAPAAATVTPVAVASSLMHSDEDMVVVRVTYDFASPFTSLLAIKAKYSLKRTYFERPRISSTITAS